MSCLLTKKSCLGQLVALLKGSRIYVTNRALQMLGRTLHTSRNRNNAFSKMGVRQKNASLCQSYQRNQPLEDTLIDQKQPNMSTQGYIPVITGSPRCRAVLRHPFKLPAVSVA